MSRRMNAAERAIAKEVRGIVDSGPGTKNCLHCYNYNYNNQRVCSKHGIKVSQSEYCQDFSKTVVIR